MTISLPGTDYNFVFNPYLKENQLGSGGMSNVYKGVNSQTGEYVAVKVLFNDLSRNPMYLERARRESSIRLDHPHVIKVYDFIEHNKKFHLITEFLDGKSIADIIDEKQPFGPFFESDSALDITKAILEGLKVLHDQKFPVIHRDIKPSNVMLCEDKQIKIMDFGVSKINNDQEEKLTTVGVKIGTISYSSPEQILGQNDLIDQRTDIYSTGITCYEMITGKVPFAGKSNYNLQEQIINQPLPPHPKIPTPIFSILKKATSKRMMDRYQNVEEFIQAIDKIRKTGTDHSRPTPFKWGANEISFLVTFILFLLFLLMILF